jgi:penicillin-binding protein 2
MPYLARTSEKSFRAERVYWLTAIAMVGISSLFLRLVYLQIIRGHALKMASDSNHTQILVEHAPRGRILDRNGKILADNQPVFVAFFSPIGLSPSDVQSNLERLAPIINVPKLELEHRFLAALRAKTMLRVSDRLSRDQAFRILQDRPHLPGVSLTIEQQRYYPEGTLASHILGYVGQITDQELDKSEGYYPGDWIGKSGLERAYDDRVLQGQDGGVVMEVDARGRQVRILEPKLPVAGKDLILTIDKDLEALAEKRLKETRHPGAAVVLNPQTGEILALASSPGFDPNTFLPSGKSDERARLLNDPELPLYNRAIQALYPPGSTFKIITALAELEESHIDVDEKFHCTGSYTLGLEKRVFKCWKQPYGHSWVNFHRAFAESCDVYFYQIGQKLGAGLIEKYAKAAGLGQRTNADLPSEKKGLLPMAWKTSVGQHWMGGDTLNYAIGQGALQVTPLQMANVAALAANEGFVMQPYLAAESRRFGESSEKLNSPRELLRVAASKRTWRLLRDSLEEVVKSGTGVAAQLPGVSVAGKTGTAQAPKGKDHAWFVAYAPTDMPKLACAVFVEHGGHGGSTAAPIAHDLLELALGIQQTSAPLVSETQAD